MPVHVQGMVDYLELEYILNHFLDALNPRVAELEQFIAIDAYEVIVLPETERPFVLGLLIPELVLYDKIALYQEIEGIVDRRSADSYLFLLQTQV